MKFAHLEENTNKILGWYADDIHGIWIEPVYEEKVIQEEEKDEEDNIIKEKITENILVKDGYWDTSKIPTPNIKVEEKDWQEAIDINANCYEDGKFIVKDFRTSEEIQVETIKNLVAEAQAYLNNTDWYYARKAETGEDVPVEVVAKRQEARGFIRNNE